MLRTAKTGTDVRVPLPQIALDALAAVPTDNYYFWSGHGTKKSCVGDYQRAFKKLYEIAKVENGDIAQMARHIAVSNNFGSAIRVRTEPFPDHKGASLQAT